MKAAALAEAEIDRIRRAVKGEASFDLATRGRYANDASFYQIMPLGVVTPQSNADVAAVLAIARDGGFSVLPRGAGTSQSGQAINRSLVLDTSRHLNRMIALDPAARRCVVQPGIVLDELNRALRPHGLWFPVDVSTASRATIGGMTANNSCGTRSLRYGTMRDNVEAITALMADGQHLSFDRAAANASNAAGAALFADLLALGAREADEIEKRFPKVQRRVGGFNLDALVPSQAPNNLAHILVGSEGTLAFFTEITLRLSPLPRSKTVGVCHFGRFYDAMDAARHIVKLGPVAVELVDSTLIALARDIEMFRPTVERFVKGDPDALLIVEFAEDDPRENDRRLRDLEALMGDLGFGWDGTGRNFGGMLAIRDPALQGAITDVRQAGLNIMMSMKDEGKPVSFVEDCAVPLEHLAEYTDRLTAVFEKHGTRGTWYAHASVGCLHVRPVLNLRLEKDVKAMRAIAEEAFEMVRAYKGSHSGEHGDGIVRSEFHRAMFGDRLADAFERVKDRFDPQALFNPGKITRPPKMDDRTLFRYPPGHKVRDFPTALDWSAWPGAGGGFQGAVEMCNNNGACRSLAGGVMCPSFRATRLERDVTRGRANTLRLAISGRLGESGLASDDVAQALSLCVSCKACRRECPTGVDVARMKIEALAARRAVHGITMRDRLVAYLPRYAPLAAALPFISNLRDTVPGAARLSERLVGLSARRPLPKWRGRRPLPASAGSADGCEVVLFADTFNAFFEPENLAAAANVLNAAGYRVVAPGPGRLCCGRTFLATGMVDEARKEARRLIAALSPFVARKIPVLGLEPSCLLTLRDEVPALLPGEASKALAGAALLFEEFLARESGAGRLQLQLNPASTSAYLHGHCHQKAFGLMKAVEDTVRLVPDVRLKTIESSCCGMAGAFGYQADTYDISMRMAELSLLPQVRASEPDAIILADGTSCRQQIAHGTGRGALHVARFLESYLYAQTSKET